MKPRSSLSKQLAENIRFARTVLKSTKLNTQLVAQLRELTQKFRFSLPSGDVIFLNHSWYVTHTGLIGLANRRRCTGIEVQPIPEFSDALNRRYAFKATVYKSKKTAGFSGYGDADPSNVSAVVQGAEMRIAETRAVNRALRKAFGIGVWSIEEIGFPAEPPQKPPESRRRPPNMDNANGNGTSIRERLYQIICEHQLDPNLVKSYATDFCAVKTLREATREQVQNFVEHLSDWAQKDKNALLCQLNSYLGYKEGAA